MSEPVSWASASVVSVPAGRPSTSDRSNSVKITTPLRLLLQGAIILWLLAVLAGGVILCLPESSKRPLVAADGWRIDGVFAEDWQPASADVSAAIRGNPASRFFRSWSGSGPTKAIARSMPFAAPEYIAVPYAGYPAEQNVSLWIQCIGSGRTVTISRGNAHEQWVERTIRLGPDWCSSAARLIATSFSATNWVAFGTPYASGLVSWLKTSVFVVAVCHALSCILVIGPGFLLASTRGRPLRGFTVMIAVSVTLGIGYLQFYLGYYLPALAMAVAVIVWAAAFAGAWELARAVKRRAIPQVFLVPVLATVLLSAFYASFLYVADVGSGSFDATYRFDPAVWSTDNQLPQVVSEAIYQRRSLKGLLGAWHVSDRPPLMTGVMLLARPLWHPLLSVGDNTRVAYLFYQVLGVVLTALWLVPSWLLFASAGIGPRLRMVAIGFLATLGPIVFNSTYIWPKLLAAALTLAGCLLLAGAAEQSRRRRLTTAAAAGALVGLGMMAHSGVAFGVPFAVLAALWRQRRDALESAAVFVVAALVIALPWGIWQRTEDPPGNALTKFALAGTYGIEQPQVGVLETVRAAYANVSLAEWWAMRLEGLRTLIGGKPEIWVAWAYERPSDALGRERLDDSMRLAQSLRAANLGWLIIAISLLSRRRSNALRRACMLWVSVGAAGILFSLFVIWSVHVTHALSYLSLLLIAAGLTGVIVTAPGWFRAAALSIHAAYFLAVWVWSPLRGVDIAEGSVVACALVVLLFVALAVTLPNEVQSDERTVAAAL